MLKLISMKDRIIS